MYGLTAFSEVASFLLLLFSSLLGVLQGLKQVDGRAFQALQAEPNKFTQTLQFLFLSTAPDPAAAKNSSLRSVGFLQDPIHYTISDNYVGEVFQSSDSQLSVLR
ncbi:hypothetical protein CICLE_v10017273mg [Citrus x clementina]|uniref:Uncharacterized protein n=1 Tax=Citrus clementina TaxID=85681 RepID=V4TK78_CITCL|nr:hypothetical protein CICLE_v10017273mg [Citrus x clementina]